MKLVPPLFFLNASKNSHFFVASTIKTDPPPLSSADHGTTSSASAPNKMHRLRGALDRQVWSAGGFTASIFGAAMVGHVAVIDVIDDDALGPWSGQQTATSMLATTPPTTPNITIN